MPSFKDIINLPGFTIEKTEGYNPMIICARYTRPPRCVHCHSKHLRTKDTFIREVRHVTIGLRTTYVRFKSHKFVCKDCGRYFNQQFLGIKKWKRVTEPHRQEVFYHHCNGESQKDLSDWLRLGKSTIERWFQDYYYLKNQELLTRQCPAVLGIDEHSVCKKKGYSTTLCDLKKHRVFDVVQGRSESEMRTYLTQLKGKENVRIICMDLSSPYRKLAQRYFPNAQIVADRFHVVRLVLYHLTKVTVSLDPELRYKRRGVSKWMRTNRVNLNDSQRQNLDEYLAKHIAIKCIYDFKETLIALLNQKKQSKKQIRPLVQDFLRYIEQLKQTPFDACQTLAKTLEQWQEPIALMLRVTKSNGITEGFHRKMKLIQRRAYGFKNFENYRLRVRILCG